jgi:hypothetical protein
MQLYGWGVGVYSTQVARVLLLGIGDWGLAKPIGWAAHQRCFLCGGAIVFYIWKNEAKGGGGTRGVRFENNNGAQDFERSG